MAIYAVLLLPIISFTLAYLAKPLTISETVSSDDIVKGETLQYYVTVRNTSLLPCASVNLKFKTLEHIETDITEKFFALMPNDSHGVKFNIQSKYRGVFRIGIEKTTMYDFLGLFKFKQYYDSTIDIIVRPRIVEIDFMHLVTAKEGQETEINFTKEEDYTNMSDLRRYQPTDGYKRIHWKVSAKRNQLISKIYSTTQKNSVEVFIDNSKMDNAIEIEDSMMEQLVSILYYSTKTGFEATLHTLDDSYATDFEGLYTIASQIEFDATGSFDDFMLEFCERDEHVENIIIIAQDITDQLKDLIEGLILKGVNVGVIK